MQPTLLPSDLTVQWLISAYGSYSRAARTLKADITNSDLEDTEMCRVINDRIMSVRRSYTVEKHLETVECMGLYVVSTVSQYCSLLMSLCKLFHSPADNVKSLVYLLRVG